VFRPAFEAVPDFIETKIKVLTDTADKVVFIWAEYCPAVVNIGHSSFEFLDCNSSFWLFTFCKLFFLYFFFLYLDVGEDVKFFLNRLASWREDEVIDWNQNFVTGVYLV